jgi:hypothetical protein
MAQVDDVRNPYGEALAALDEANASPVPIGADSGTMFGAAQLKATKAAALASLAAADASYAVRNELEALGAKLARKS